MRSPNFIIVEAEDNYNNMEDNVIVNSSIETVSRINRVATVISAPDYTILREGDKVLLHHNILRLSNDINGNIQHSMFHIEGNRYFVPLSEVLMYKRGTVEWKSITPFVFVKAIESEDYKIGSYTIKGDINSYKGKKKLRGVVSFINNDLEKQGLKEGDTVYFSEFSEHEYEFEKIIYYKMKTEDILLKITY